MGGDEVPRTILVTGAAGNLGSRLARHLLGSPDRLRLMVHRTPLPSGLDEAAGVEVVSADLSRPETLRPAVRGVDTVVHFAGVLFAPRPERFLPTTNTRWFRNLLEACLAERVDRVVLISFPHVEGPTTPQHPATGRLDGTPISAHARTRLEEERLLFEQTEGTATTPVVLRLGMVYGRGILMIEAARWLARRRLLGVWREPTWIHLISTDDYLAATAAAATRPGVGGIYHVGDERPLTLQQFLDEAGEVWGAARPWRMPLWLIRAAAGLCELGATVLRTRSPLTRDFIEIGRVSYCGQTDRTRSELLEELRYPTFDEGKATLA
jgi:nucleoside-diphosphate-sugar epimerase